MKIGEYTVIQNPHMIDRIFTRKQTRKFKNHRWVKKYKKKHSYPVPQKDVFISESDKVIFCHPETYRVLELEIERGRVAKAQTTENQRMSIMPSYAFGPFRNPGLIYSNCAS